MIKIAIYLKQEDIKVERELRQKIAILKTLRQTINKEDQGIIIQNFKHFFPLDKDLISFLEKEYPKSGYEVGQKLVKWINGMEILADRIKKKL